jgi:EAL domain-containing protein (putative c-di-GMP-specific phosphodiesterase class I)
VASEALAQLGGSVETVENGVQAVQAVGSAGYDIVFMDGSMPEMDGFEATRRIREAEAGVGAERPRTIIVALTAHVIGASADAWRQSGMDDILHKPFTIAKLADCIQRLAPHLTAATDGSAQPATNGTRAADRDTPGAPRIDESLLDPDAIAQLLHMQTMGKADFVDKVFGLYGDHAPAATTRVHDAAVQGNIDECAQAAHALKSMSYNIGARRVAELARSIESTARTRGELPNDVVVKELSATLQSTLEALSKQFRQVDEQESRRLEGPAVASSMEDLEQALPLALERNELLVLYQPLVDRTGERTCGVEALVRWRRADGEVVSPAAFIPLAERTGVIHEIGDWVLRRACEDAAAWPSLTVAVNVSPIQFGRPDLADRCCRVLSETGFDGSRLEIEITESALLEAEHAVLRAMERLRARGVTFALDDFGTGYSSLTYLRRFPFGKIKIDRSFVMHVDSALEATIVHAVASIGRSLGLKLVAEGVEEAAQHRFLAAAGIHFMQGYLFGKPMPKGAISERLALERQQSASGSPVRAAS